MKKTVSAVCAAILVLMLLVPCFGSAEEYYTPGESPFRKPAFLSP